MMMQCQARVFRCIIDSFICMIVYIRQMRRENPSIQACLDESKSEINRRRIDLFNDPNYGIVLGFLDKYRTVLDLPNYPLQLLEDHLVQYDGKNSTRLIDFYFMLLKRLSLAKNAQREKFDSIIIKFASRFETTDLLANGYLPADIHTKIRVLKNLLESQFDWNQNFRNILSDQSSQEIKSLPIGRDRFGASYWCFTDKHGFVRLFREEVDIDRTWTIVAKNQEELEKFIKLLIADSVVRKRFTERTLDYQPSSNEFEQFSHDENVSETSTKRKRGRPQELEKVQLVTGSQTRKRQLIEDDETSVDDISLAMRSQNVSTRKPACKTKPQKKAKVRHHRRKSSSEDEYNSDDYLPTPSPLFVDEVDEQIRSAKTAQTSTTITNCSVCSKSDRPEVLLLCDGCNDAYHLECLHPQLLSVPDGDWYCPLCEHKQLSNNLIEKFKELEINQNSNLSTSSYMDEDQCSMSLRGRLDLDQQMPDFHLQLPKKITRLLHRRDRNTEQQSKTHPTRVDQPSIDTNDPSGLNEKLGSPLVYVTSDEQHCQMKSVITNSKQTLQIVRRWNDVQRRSRLRLSNKTMALDYTDENSNLCLDDEFSKSNPIHPTTLISFDTYSSQNMLQKLDANFDRLTRDIQFAVNEAHLLPTVFSSDQEHVKRIPKKFSSPTRTKNPFSPLFSLDGIDH